METEKTDRAKEETAVVLDFLPNGYSYDDRPMYMKTPIAQAIGKEHFVLLELVPKKGVHLQPFEEVYIGDGKRDKIHHIVGKMPISKLTATAKSEMEFVIKDIVNNMVYSISNSGFFIISRHNKTHKVIFFRFWIIKKSAFIFKIKY